MRAWSTGPTCPSWKEVMVGRKWEPPAVARVEGMVDGLVDGLVDGEEEEVRAEEVRAEM